MTEKKQGLLGGFLGQRAEEDNGRPSSGAEASQAPQEAGRVEAYEEDWYRSLKMLAERQQELVAEEEEEETEETPAEAIEATQVPPETVTAETVTAETVTAETVTAVAPEAAARAAEVSPEATVEATLEAPAARDDTGASVQDATLATGTTGPTQVLAAAGPPEPDAAGGAPSSVAAPAEPPGELREHATQPIEIPEQPSQAALAEPTVGPAPPTSPVIRQPEGPAASLTSTDPVARKAALQELALAEMSEADERQVGALVLDPDPEIRRLALDVLSAQPERVDDGTVRQALQDPSDDVREAAVRLVAKRGRRDLAHLLPFVGARRWPLSQRTALTALPGMIAAGPPLAEEDFASILFAVSELDSPPLATEGPALAELAAVIGIARLIEALSAPDGRRLGAVRLLTGDRSSAVLRALASHLADPLEEIRIAAAAASEELARNEASVAPAGLPSLDVAATSGDQTERVASLARALTDMDESVRHLALSGLAGIDRATVLQWVREAVRSDDAELASVAAGTAELLELAEAAPDLLARCVELSGDARQPLLDALISFRLEPGRLTALLAAIDDSRRPGAIHVVWELGGPFVLPYLRGHLDDPSVPARVAVLDVFGLSGDPGLPALAKGVLETDVSADVRTAAVRMIARGSGEAWTAAIGRALQDPDPGVRVSAVETVVPSSEDGTVQLLIQALTDTAQEVRQAAALRLASSSGADREFLWQVLRSSGREERARLVKTFEVTSPGSLTEPALEHLRSLDQEDRILAVEIVGCGSSQACVEAAIQALQDPAAPVRRAATATHAQLRNPSATGALGKALGDPDPEVRRGVVKALGVIDDEAVLGFLVSALEDPDISVRKAASEVLTEWSSPAVAKRLAGVLAVPTLRDSASELLMKMGPSAVELLIDVLAHGNPEIVPIVGSLLRNIAGVRPFMDMLGSTDPNRRLRAIEAIGAIGDPTTPDVLTAALWDPDERIRLRAAQLLARFGSPRTEEALLRVVTSDPVQQVVEGAREALAAIRPADR